MAIDFGGTVLSKAHVEMNETAFDVYRASWQLRCTFEASVLGGTVLVVVNTHVQGNAFCPRGWPKSFSGVPCYPNFVPWAWECKKLGAALCAKSVSGSASFGAHAHSNELIVNYFKGTVLPVGKQHMHEDAFQLRRRTCWSDRILFHATTFHCAAPMPGNHL